MARGGQGSPNDKRHAAAERSQPADTHRQRPTSASACKLRGSASLDNVDGACSGDWTVKSQGAETSPLHANRTNTSRRAHQRLGNSYTAYDRSPPSSVASSSSASSTSSRASSYATSESHSIDIPDLSTLNIR
eukprot:scaffold403883_cov43-Prasinocladus_malaysianus.AAC.1